MQLSADRVKGESTVGRRGVRGVSAAPDRCNNRSGAAEPLCVLL